MIKREDQLKFDGNPKFPLLDFGGYYTDGWEIPTHWAVDTDCQLWVDNAHGGCLEREKHEKFAYDEVEYMEYGKFDACNRMRKALNMLPLAPPWMRTAIQMNWSPPKDFDHTQYEW